MASDVYSEQDLLPLRIEAVEIENRDMVQAFQAEDADAVLQIIGPPVGPWSSWISLRWALSVRKKMGTTLPPEFRDFNNHLNTLDGRKRTFPLQMWSQAESLELALAGLYYDGGTGTVQCFVCRIVFRDLHPLGGRCPWEKHNELVPSCLQLKRYQSDGQATTSAARRRRYNSDSAMEDLEDQN